MAGSPAVRPSGPGTSPPPAPPVEEPQLGGWGRQAPDAPWSCAHGGIQWQPWTRLPAGHHLAQRAGGLSPVGFRKGQPDRRGTASSFALSAHQGVSPRCKIALLLQVQLCPAFSERGVWHPGHLPPLRCSPCRRHRPFEARDLVPPLLQASVLGRGLGPPPAAALPLRSPPIPVFPAPSFLLPSEPATVSSLD